MACTNCDSALHASAPMRGRIAGRARDRGLERVLLQGGATRFDQGFDAITRVRPSMPAAYYQGLLAVSEHETNIGRGWKGAGAGSNNAGAVQCHSIADPCPADCFPQDDSHPDGTEYHACFRIYPSLDDGLADVARILGKPAIAAVLENPNADGSISADAIATAMHGAHYFEGSCPNATHAGASKTSAQCVAEAIDGYANALELAATRVATGLGQPLLIFRGPSFAAAGAGLFAGVSLWELALVGVAGWATWEAMT